MGREPAHRPGGTGREEKGKVAKFTYKAIYGKYTYECEAPSAPEHLITKKSLLIAAEKDYMRRLGVPATHYDYENASYVITHPALEGRPVPEFEIVEEANIVRNHDFEGK